MSYGLTHENWPISVAFLNFFFHIRDIRKYEVLVSWLDRKADIEYYAKLPEGSLIPELNPSVPYVEEWSNLQYQ